MSEATLRAALAHRLRRLNKALAYTKRHKHEFKKSDYKLIKLALKDERKFLRSLV